MGIFERRFVLSRPLKVCKSLMKTFRAFIRMLELAWQAHGLIFSAIILMSILSGLAPISLAWISKLIFDNISRNLIMQNSVSLQLWILLGVQTLIAALTTMIAPLNNFLYLEFGQRLTLTMQTSLHQKLFDFVGIAHHENFEVQNSIRLAQQGGHQSISQAIALSKNFIQASVTLFGFFTVLLTLNPLLALMMVVSVLPHLRLEFNLGYKRFALANKISFNDRRSSYYSHLFSNTQAFSELQLFNLGDFFLNRMLEDIKRAYMVKRKQQIYELRWQIGLGNISNLIAAGALVFVTLQAFAGAITLGDLTIFVAAVSGVQKTLQIIFTSIARFNETVLFFGHYENIISLKPTLPICTAPREVPQLKKGIEFRNVWFRYSKTEKWILQGLNLTIPAKKSLAVIGQNGAGKTTLAKLLTRLYDPTIGEILWDGIDIREFNPTELRKNISAIFQDFMRYDLSVQENIGLGDVKNLQDLTLVKEAATKANIHDDVISFPKDYKTILSRTLLENQSESGIGLSGGQWQKIAIARAFMRQASLLILDEPSSALDLKSEEEIHTNFFELASKKTGFLISHRFSTVRMAQVIAVMEHGKIVEYGTHSSLIALNGIYAKLFLAQKRQYNL
jgi:ATP-binding cassette subfamily B protein